MSVTTALQKQISTTPTPPPDTTVTSPSDSPAPDKTDYSGVQAAVMDNKRRQDHLLDRMQADDARLAALKPPELQPMPKQPDVQNTPPSERWGSVAMFMAGLGSLLTRQPLTTALNSMAEVNHAFNEGDAAKAKQAFDGWKIASDNAIKLNEFQNKAYEGALEKISTDYKGAVSEANVIAHSLKDDVVIQLIAAGRGDDALRMLGGRAAAASQLNDRAQLYAADFQMEMAWRQAHPNATPQEISAAKQTIYGKHAAPDDAGARPPTSVPGQQLADVKRDLKQQHPDWTEGQLDQAANHQLQQSKQVDKPLTPQQKDEETLALSRFKQEHNGQSPGPDDEPEMALNRVHARMMSKTGEPVSADDPNVPIVAKGIAEYRLAPLSGFTLKTPFGQAVEAQILQINPDYQATQFGARSKAARDFATGTPGNSVRSLNVAISHLETLRELSEALQNNDLTALNRVGNLISGWTGDPAPTNLDAARQIVSAEIIKAIVASGGGVGERQEAQEKVGTQQSPEQLAGLVETYKKLLGGQLRGLKQQYEQTTGMKNFDDRLSPEARDQLEKTSHSIMTAENEDAYNAMPAGTWWRKPGDPLGSHRVKN